MQGLEGQLIFLSAEEVSSRLAEGVLTDSMLCLYNIYIYFKISFTQAHPVPLPLSLFNYDSICFPLLPLLLNPLQHGMHTYIPLKELSSESPTCGNFKNQEILLILSRLTFSSWPFLWHLILFIILYCFSVSNFLYPLSVSSSFCCFYPLISFSPSLSC